MPTSTGAGFCRIYCLLWASLLHTLHDMVFYFHLFKESDMHYVTSSVAAKWGMSQFSGQGGSTVDGDAFASFFDKLKSQAQEKNKGFTDLLSWLGGSFPSASLKPGEVEPGIKGTEKQFGKEEGDQVALDESALSAMANNSQFAQTVESAIAQFFNSTNSSPTEGTYNQRLVSVTSITIRFSVVTRTEGSGSLKSAEEFMTDFHDKLKEMIDSFFNLSGTGDKTDANGDETAGNEDSEKADETKDIAKLPSFFFGSNASWSMELFYSQASFGSDGKISSGGSIQWQFGGSMSSSIGQLTSSSMFGAMGAGFQFGSSAFTSFIGSDLSNFGLSADNFRQDDGGLFMRLRESRSLLSELMELYNSGVQTKEPTVTTAEETTAPAEAAPAVQ